MTLENLQLGFRLGDTWSSDEWAVLVNDLPVNLAVDGWVVRAQARRRPDKEIVVEWSTTNGRIQLEEFEVEYGEGLSGITSTVRMKHSAFDSDSWQPFSSEFEMEIERGTGPNIERYTIVSGRVVAYQDSTDT